ncbi:peptidase domain-containing ABC transporter [Roseomonas marmotae]|uniref:Peptidase domain-containing ABC transporter n=2 Tax=Roseomonas marmotae TaxID=2768161 RepID=A0ABS3KG01_9PROT|nr:peptidase domain-containing ABC transporter [Roseomonas marmotae]MBO1076404.1 peptidase domain-containing ABC transporter [Roseomonas marmotae]QTI80753.1 peptidase domain-containing ABC transporter [Roseomonas marmotae]
MPVVIQSEAAECGLACLAMLASHHGQRVDLAAMRRRFATSLKGMSLRDLVGVGGRMGLATRALRLEMADLRKLRLPCILHWDQNHFVVLARLTPRGAVIHDPAIGRRRLSLQEISRRFTGVALEAWPAEGFQKGEERARLSLMAMLRRTVGLGRAMAQVLALSLLMELAVIAMPIAFQLVVDEVVVAGDYDLLTLIALGMVVLLLLEVGSRFARSWAAMIFGSSLVLQWKVSLFDQLMRLPLDFFEKRHVGDIVSRFHSLDQVRDVLTTRAVLALLDGVMAIALLAMMALYGGWLALVALAALALYLALRLAVWRPFRLLSEEAIIHEAQENSHFMESARGMASLKALNLEPRRRAVWINHLVERVGAAMRLEKFGIGYTAAAQALFGLDRILIIWLGARAVLAGQMSVGMLIAFLAFQDQFTSRVNGFVDTLLDLRMLSLHGERLADIALATPEPVGGGEGNPALPAPALARPPAAQAAAAEAAAMALRGIRFRYADNDPEIIAGLSEDIPAGACIGVAGPSGCGKSTLLRIMAGLIPPTSGQVLVDGVPLSTLGPAAHRQRVGCVLQDDRLFAGSIAENIAGFDPNPDEHWLQLVADIAAIHADILRMPMGYATRVGDMGSTLSGGQRQRVVLARALYRRPAILLLDEATSHLDEATEARINDAIRQLPMTRVLIAHRPSSLAVAERVIRLG